MGDSEKPLQLQITTLDYSDFLGRIIIGRVHNGVIKQGQSALIKDDGSIKKAASANCWASKGCSASRSKASAGDLVAVAGFDDVNIGETIACPDEPTALPLIKVDEPTLQMTFVVNDSPSPARRASSSPAVRCATVSAGTAHQRAAREDTDPGPLRRQRAVSFTWAS